MQNSNIYEEILYQALGKAIRPLSVQLTGGSSFNTTVRIKTERQLYFVKTNQQVSADPFKKEEGGLDLLRRSTSLAIPATYGCGRIGDVNFLLMDWVEESERTVGYWEVLARGLAQLHKTNEEQFGLDEDNYIALLPQSNNWSMDWIEFFIEQRIEKTIAIAQDKQVIETSLVKKIRNSYPRLSNIFPIEKPSLIHGDLWSGNVMTGAAGEPVLIDPAVYYGHREMDLAFTRLFGGFPERFYDAYQESFPTAPRFEERSDLYNLYPLLVHLALFGKSYASAIETTVDRIN